MKQLKDLLLMEEKPLLNMLGKIPNAQVSPDDYVFIEGNGSPLLFIAHVDTVRRESVTLLRSRNVLTNKENHPLGADDRAGVFALLEIRRRCLEEHLPMPSFLFTNGEERGGIGARAFCNDCLSVDDVYLMVEVDRRGCGQYVYYTWDIPKEVKCYVESFGFNEEEGSFSDVALLSEQYMIPGINVSAGYYAEHSGREHLHYDELGLTINRLMAMVRSPIVELYPLSLEDVTSPYVYERVGSYGLRNKGYNSRGLYDYDEFDDYDYERKQLKVVKGGKEEQLDLTPEELLHSVGMEWYWNVVEAVAMDQNFCNVCDEYLEDCVCGEVFNASLIQAGRIAKTHGLTTQQVLLAGADFVQEDGILKSMIEGYALYKRLPQDRLCPYCAVKFGYASGEDELLEVGVKVIDEQTALRLAISTPYSSGWAPDFYDCPICHGMRLVTEARFFDGIIALGALDVKVVDDLSYDLVDAYLFSGDRKGADDEY